MRKIQTLLAALCLLPALVFVGQATAVDVFQPCQEGGQDSTVCESKTAQETGDRNPIFGPDGILTMVINLISAIVGIAAVIVIILAGLKFITSGTNPQDVNNAREMVIYAAVGLVVAVSAQLFVRVFLAQIG